MKKSFRCSDRFISNNISNFTVEITQQCNFRCIYCCYSGSYTGMRTHTSKVMDMKTILHSIEFIKLHAHASDKIVVSFFGGEALLGLDSILIFVDNLNQFFGDRVSFDISTNGLLLTTEIIDQLMCYNIGVSVSLDGCKEIHDKYRKTISGKESYDTIVSNLKCFKERYPEEYKKRIRLLVTVGSLEDIMAMNDNYSNFKELLGDKPLFISHIYPNFSKNELYEDDFTLRKRFYDKALEHKKNGINDLYTIVLDDLLKKKDKVFSCIESCNTVNLKTCLDDMYCIFIDVEGQLYPCEKFKPCHFIGDVKTGINDKLLRKWSVIYNFRRTALCGDCQQIEYCKRCLADLKMSFSEQKQMCAIYKENLELSKTYNDKINAYETNK